MSVEKGVRLSLSLDFLMSHHFRVSWSLAFTTSAKWCRSPESAFFRSEASQVYYIYTHDIF
jgi:hypothetical protein